MNKIQRSYSNVIFIIQQIFSDLRAVLIVILVKQVWNVYIVDSPLKHSIAPEMPKQLYIIRTVGSGSGVHFLKVFGDQMF